MLSIRGGGAGGLSRAMEGSDNLRASIEGEEEEEEEEVNKDEVKEEKKVKSEDEIGGAGSRVEWKGKGNI